MPFSGKATYTAGSTLPEIAEDVSDLVSLASPYETALLDALGDPARPARSTVHEWLEDSLLPNSSTINDSTYTNVLTDTTFVITHVDRFRVGDLIRIEGATEVMLVTIVDTGSSTLTVTRGYGASAASSLSNGAKVIILANAALEGADAAAARFTAQSRRINYTQIFSSTVEVSGSELAVKQLGVADELNYQKQQRTRELLRDLENSVINGRAPASSPEGSASVRRTMRGILSFVTTNVFVPSVSDFPEETALTEIQLNLALREVWQGSAGQVDTIVCGGREKRMINNFLASSRRYTPQSDTFRDNVSVYESDFGVCRIVMSRWMPSGVVLLLDSSRIEVMPLSGRTFAYKPLARTGDRESGQVVGEYTLELRNENAHGVITGLLG